MDTKLECAIPAFDTNHTKQVISISSHLRILRYTSKTLRFILRVHQIFNGEDLIEFFH